MVPIPGSLLGMANPQDPTPLPNKVVQGQAKVQIPSSNRPPANSTTNGTRHCLSEGCEFYGNEKTDYLCSACYKARQQKNDCVKTRL